MGDSRWRSKIQSLLNATGCISSFVFTNPGRKCVVLLDKKLSLLLLGLKLSHQLVQSQRHLSDLICSLMV